MIGGLLQKLGVKGSRSKAKRPVSVIQATNPAESGFSQDVFLSPDALAINEARLCHLASLGLDLAGKTVLEVGGGIGLHTCFFESLGCVVTCTDGRLDNVQETKRRYPHRNASVLDLDRETDLRHLGTFDLIYCYGTLYHLSKPEEALSALAKVCRGQILLETCVTPGDEELLHPVQEPALNPNQAVSGLGCRPTRKWVMRQLREQFGWAYNSVTQPLHHDFERNWLEPAPRKLYRAIFVGSKQPLNLPTLSETVCDLQNCVPDDSRGIWLDVGPRAGETTFQRAADAPRLAVYAFQPNLRLAAERFNALPNYSVVPMAVSGENGFERAKSNSNWASPGKTEPDQESAKDASANRQTQNVVPTTRLDSFLTAMGIAQVDFLNIDNGLSDLSVVQSVGAKLASIRKIKVGVPVGPKQSEGGTGSKQEIVRRLAEDGFVLVAEQPGSHKGAENLIFFQAGSLPKDIRPLDVPQTYTTEAGQKILREISEERLLALARSVAELRPLVVYPGWTFSGAEENPAPEIKLRQAIWQTCWERKLDKPILFPWYHGLKINLYLGNDMSRPTFIGGCIEPNEFVFMESILKPSMVMMDVGANDGFFTVLAARQVGEKGRVYAFEPSEREYARLQANLELNQLSNVQTVRKAVANAGGQGLLRICEYGHEGQNTLGDFVHKVSEEGVQDVELCTLDDFFKDEKLSRLDFIKIDVEGAEHKVLSGGRELISRFKPVIMLELLDSALNKQGSSAKEVVSLLNDMGYLIYDFSPKTGRLAESDLKAHSDNIVASPAPLASS
jgi:FkbM family methyltransferase